MPSHQARIGRNHHAPLLHKNLQNRRGPLVHARVSRPQHVDEWASEREGLRAYWSATLPLDREFDRRSGRARWRRDHRLDVTRRRALERLATPLSLL